MAATVCATAQPAATPGSAWIHVPSLGVQLQGPSDAKVTAVPASVFVADAAFKLNLFPVTAYSAASAAAQQARLQIEPGFVKFTKVELGATTWRFDYVLAQGTSGTVARIAPGRALDCSIHHVSLAIAAAVAASCASAKQL